MNENTLDDQYWSNRYLSQQTGWDIGEASAPLKEYFQQLTDKSIHILIPGCGNAYEAKELLDLGFAHITLLDISSELVEKLQAQFQHTAVRVLHEDFFQHQEKYDLIVEQTFFCALDPSLRQQYVTKMVELLKPGGKLVGVLFNRAFEGGPPFGGSKEEYEKIFAEKLYIKKMEPCYNSISPRMGTELFFIAQKQ